MSIAFVFWIVIVYSLQKKKLRCNGGGDPPERIEAGKKTCPPDSRYKVLQNANIFVEK